MVTLINWFSNNKEWVFSGFGVTLILLIISLFKKSKPSQYQKSGNNSTNYQAGGNINIGGKNDK
ncbi:hypothetical protein Cthiooxydans_41200 [Comamonas thiooxydans]|uniref:hypothetical protein n=1 Tax=Comamonas thiooxydans TaxID=363952 RepID=UPI001E3A4CA3|nr:hypothetical protein [Comamonas thiooxydans]BDB71708.1 hypothetical protein Cthiooxydans_41200 [Comamonas thiooxydans]